MLINILKNYLKFELANELLKLQLRRPLKEYILRDMFVSSASALVASQGSTEHTALACIEKINELAGTALGLQRKAQPWRFTKPW